MKTILALIFYTYLAHSAQFYIFNKGLPSQIPTLQDNVVLKHFRMMIIANDLFNLNAYNLNHYLANNDHNITQILIPSYLMDSKRASIFDHNKATNIFTMIITAEEYDDNIKTKDIIVSVENLQFTTNIDIDYQIKIDIEGYSFIDDVLHVKHTEYLTKKQRRYFAKINRNMIRYFL